MPHFKCVSVLTAKTLLETFCFGHSKLFKRWRCAKIIFENWVRFDRVICYPKSTLSHFYGPACISQTRCNIQFPVTRWRNLHKKHLYKKVACLTFFLAQVFFSGKSLLHWIERSWVPHVREIAETCITRQHFDARKLTQVSCKVSWSCVTGIRLCCTNERLETPV